MGARCMQDSTLVLDQWVSKTGKGVLETNYPRVRPDRVFSLGVKLLGGAIIALLAAIVLFLVWSSWPSLHKFGAGFLTSSTWDPVALHFGALPLIWGTVVSSFLALLIAGPLSVAVALFLNELAPARVGRIVGFFVEMLAAIPSVVYGLWGVFVLAPFLRQYFQPLVIDNLGFLPFFAGPPYGVGMCTAGLILSLMILPTISSLCREVFRTIPREDKEAALALGSTRWEMMKLAVLRTAKSGIFGAMILGLGRALGETMAVTMVIGNRSEIGLSLFSPAQTMASALANEYAEAIEGMHIAALGEVGLVLFLVTLFINLLARLLIKRFAPQKVVV